MSGYLFMYGPLDGKWVDVFGEVDYYEALELEETQEITDADMGAQAAPVKKIVYFKQHIANNVYVFIPDNIKRHHGSGINGHLVRKLVASYQGGKHESV